MRERKGKTNQQDRKTTTGLPKRLVDRVSDRQFCVRTAWTRF